MRLQVLDPSPRFSCGICTACCDQPWNTLIETGKAQALERHDFSAYPQLSGVKFYHASKDAPAGFHVLAKGEGTKCLFLDSDGLCIIHKEMGAAAKPHGCLRFPYVIARTPGDDRISVDYGCPAVQESKGKLLEDQMEDIQMVFKPASSAAAGDGRVYLAPGVALERENADALYDRLVALFEPNRPGEIWDRFSEALTLLVGVLRRQKAPNGESEADLGAILAGGGVPSGTPEAPVIHAYPNVSIAPSPARLLFAATLFRDTVPRDTMQNMGLWKRLTMLPKLMSLAKLTGTYPSRLMGRNVNIGEVMRHPLEPELSPESAQLLTGYYRSRVWQRLLVGSRLTMVAGLHQHIHDLNAVMFFARAEAHHAGEERLTHETVRRALRYVEFHLANQPRHFDQNLVGWFRTQLESPTTALQSLRLMALKPAPETTEVARVEAAEATSHSA